jgi:hypothetical protein
MGRFIRREWGSLLIWSIAALLLWYGLEVDRTKLPGAIGLIVAGLVNEFIIRVIGTNKEDRT